MHGGVWLQRERERERERETSMMSAKEKNLIERFEMRVKSKQYSIVMAL